MLSAILLCGLFLIPQSIACSSPIKIYEKYWPSPFFNETKTVYQEDANEIPYQQTTMVYQENSDSSSLSGNGVDGDWSTYEKFDEATGANWWQQYFNYTIPNGAAGAEWNVKCKNSVSQEKSWTINQSALDETQLSFKSEATDIGFQHCVYYDGTWNYIGGQGGDEGPEYWWYEDSVTWTINPVEAYDGDWNTSIYYPNWQFNYIKPAGAIKATLKFKADLGTFYYEIPSDCWNYDSNKLYFQSYTTDNSGVRVQCRNGPGDQWTGWVDLGFPGYDYVYEEAIIWTVYVTHPMPNKYTLVSGQTRIGQSYTIGATGLKQTHRLSSIELDVFHSGYPGKVWVEFYNVNRYGVPTGKAISKGFFDGNNTLQQGLGYQNVVVQMSPKIWEFYRTKYVFTVRVTGPGQIGIGFNGNNIEEGIHIIPYPKGEMIRSLDNGLHWTLDKTSSVWFREYGYT